MILNELGIPVGTKIKRIGNIKMGEYQFYKINSLATISKAKRDYDGSSYIVIESDNMFNEIDLSSIKIPEGYEWTGEFRPPLSYEIALGDDLKPQIMNQFIPCNYMILRRKKTKNKYLVIKYLLSKHATAPIGNFSIKELGFLPQYAPNSAEVIEVEE